ncbi:MAG: type IV conjugative transfer system lipoprotein TraV [Rhizobacter sp.]
MKSLRVFALDLNPRLALHAACAATVVLLAGCSGLGGGSSLTCKLPDGARCDSVSNTYSESMRGELPGQRKRGGIEGGSSSGAPSTSGASQRGSDGVMMYTDPRMTQVGMPLRSQPRIVRVWIKPWEDSDGDLHDQTFVYLPVDEGRWMVDHKQREVRNSHAPIRPSSRISSLGDATSLSAASMPVPVSERRVPVEASAPATQPGKPTTQLVEAIQRAKAAQPANTPARAEGGRSGS